MSAGLDFAATQVDSLEQALLEGMGPARLNPPRHLLPQAQLDVQLRHCGVEWLGVLLGWAAMAWGPSWIVPPAVLWVAMRLHALGVVLHDVAHMAPQRGWRLRLVSALAGWPVASTVEAMRYHHLRHHRDSCMAQDPYRKPDLSGRPGLLFLYWLRTILIVPAWTLRGPLGLLSLPIRPLRQVYGRGFLQDRSGQDLRDAPQVLDCARAELGQVLAHGVVLALAIWGGPALRQAIWLGLVLPALTASLLCGWRLLQEHNYVQVQDRRLASILTSTRDHNLSGLGRLLFAPRNIGYHVVHHLHPQVAKEALPALRDWYREQLGERYPPQATLWPRAGV